MSASEGLARALEASRLCAQTWELLPASVRDAELRRADAILEALRGADAATRLALIRDLMPETHAVVPKEASEAMKRAGDNALAGWIAPAMHSDCAYRAMLAAAAQEGVSDAG